MRVLLKRKNYSKQSNGDKTVPNRQRVQNRHIRRQTHSATHALKSSLRGSNRIKKLFRPPGFPETQLSPFCHRYELPEGTSGDDKLVIPEPLEVVRDEIGAQMEMSSLKWKVTCLASAYQRVCDLIECG